MKLMSPGTYLGAPAASSPVRKFFQSYLELSLAWTGQQELAKSYTGHHLPRLNYLGLGLHPTLSS